MFPVQRTTRYSLIIKGKKIFIFFFFKKKKKYILIIKFIIIIQLCMIYINLFFMIYFILFIYIYLNDILLLKNVKIYLNILTKIIQIIMI